MKKRTINKLGISSSFTIDGSICIICFDFIDQFLRLGVFGEVDDPEDNIDNDEYQCHDSEDMECRTVFLE